jgi:hypothetical protein
MRQGNGGRVLEPGWCNMHTTIHTLEREGGALALHFPFAFSSTVTPPPRTPRPHTSSRLSLLFFRCTAFHCLHSNTSLSALTNQLSQHPVTSSLLPACQELREGFLSLRHNDESSLRERAGLTRASAAGVWVGGRSHLLSDGSEFSDESAGDME